MHIRFYPRQMSLLLIRLDPHRPLVNMSEYYNFRSHCSTSSTYIYSRLSGTMNVKGFLDVHVVVGPGGVAVGGGGWFEVVGLDWKALLIWTTELRSAVSDKSHEAHSFTISLCVFTHQTSTGAHTHTHPLKDMRQTRREKQIAQVYTCQPAVHESGLLLSVLHSVHTHTHTHSRHSGSLQIGLPHFNKSSNFQELTAQAYSLLKCTQAGFFNQLFKNGSCY